MKSILKVLAGFLFIGSIDGYFLLQQAPEPGRGNYLPVAAMAAGAFACAVLSIGGSSKYGPSNRKMLFWKISFLILLGIGFGVYYFFFSGQG